MQWVFRAVLLKTAACCKTNPVKAVRVNQNSEVVAGQLNNELKLTMKLSKAEWSNRLRR